MSYASTHSRLTHGPLCEVLMCHTLVHRQIRGHKVAIMSFCLNPKLKSYATAHTRSAYRLPLNVALKHLYSAVVVVPVEEFNALYRHKSLLWGYAYRPYATNPYQFGFLDPIDITYTKHGAESPDSKCDLSARFPVSSVGV